MSINSTLQSTITRTRPWRILFEKGQARTLRASAAPIVGGEDEQVIEQKKGKKTNGTPATLGEALMQEVVVASSSKERRRARPVTLAEDKRQGPGDENPEKRRERQESAPRQGRKGQGKSAKVRTNVHLTSPAAPAIGGPGNGPGSKEHQLTVIACLTQPSKHISKGFTSILRPKRSQNVCLLQLHNTDGGCAASEHSAYKLQLESIPHLSSDLQTYYLGTRR